VNQVASGPRRHAREAALQVLFAAEAKGELDPEVVGSTYDQVLQEFSLPRRSRERAHVLVMGVAQNLKAIDERISTASAHWRVPRLAGVDRNVLRIASYELLFEPETPAEVVIDEAVEIARRFASDSSPAFVNGVLDAIARDRDASRS
jgi:N utilization substance protein B